jgi:hypothetical protein
MLIKLAAAGLLTAASSASAQVPYGRAVSVGSGASALRGTLLSPVGRARGNPILMLAGSGPTDRDGNSPLGVTAKPYRLLAEGLAERGVATLRVDKRAVAASRGAASREEDLRIETYADDARVWAARLKAETRARCVWLLGHSEGSLIAQLAGKNNTDVCGLILVSGPGRRGAELIREQVGSQLPEPLKSQAFAALSELEAGRTVEGPPQLAALFRASVQPYLISWFRHDPAQLLRGYSRPVLIVHGTTDIQATLADAERLAAANPNAVLIKLEGVNHVLKVAPLARVANLATYADPNLPLAPGVVDAIAGFATAHLRR